QPGGLAAEHGWGGVLARCGLVRPDCSDDCERRDRPAPAELTGWLSGWIATDGNLPCTIFPLTSLLFCFTGSSFEAWRRAVRFGGFGSFLCSDRTARPRLWRQASLRVRWQPGGRESTSCVACCIT